MPVTEIDLGERVLAVHEAGDPDGPAILYHHGTPSLGTLFEPWVDDALARGARLVGFDRAGYGASSAMPGRRVGDVASDCAAILERLRIERCVTWGISGGGPHALACAALLGDRVAAVATLGAPAPFDAEGLNWFLGMGSDNLVEFGLALAGREHLQGFCTQAAEAMAAGDRDVLIEAVASLAGPADRAVLRGPVGDFLTATAPAALAHGVGGWVDDDLAFLHPFGFGVEQVEVPALIVHGQQDRFVPVEHGRWLAQAIPGAEAWIGEEEGHLTAMVDRVADVHAWLLDRLAAS